VAARRTSKTKNRIKKAVSKAKAALKKVVTRAKTKAGTKRRKKRAKRRAPVPAIEPPRPGGATGKPARRVGRPPARKRRTGTPALSVAGGGVAVPRRR
jgi:hypothetical protein